MSASGDRDGNSNSEGLAELVIRHGRLPTTWLDSPVLRECLGQLTDLGANQLRAEPRRLAQRHTELAREAQETAARNYAVFIRSAEATRALSVELSRVEFTVESLLSDRLPRLTGRCAAFSESVGQLASRRRRVQLGLHRHAQVLEVLEIPQLLDTCVRNDYWEEALELVSYAKRLERGRGLLEAQVVTSVLDEVRRVSEQMLAQVAGRLRSGRLQLPDCLRLLGYLRRLAAYPEPQLRLHFLAARDAYLSGQLAALQEDDPYQHARQTAEDTRSMIFDTVTHYRAAFADQDPLLSSADGPASESGLLHCWLTHRVCLFLECLERDLGRGAGANGRLESLLSCCMYFGASLAKIGADFRPHLLDLFSRAAMTQLRVSIEIALKHFHSAVYSYALALPATAVAPANWDSGSGIEEFNEDNGSNIRGSIKASMGFNVDEIPPPNDLVNYPPLAVLLNGMLTGLNELRPCMSVCLVPALCSAVSDLMQRSVAVLAGWYSSETGALTPAERQGFALCCTAFKKCLLPHANRCLVSMCDQDMAAAYLGLTATQRATDLREFGCLDIETLCEPLKPFLSPENEQESKPTQSVDTGVVDEASSTGESIKQLPPNDSLPKMTTDSEKVDCLEASQTEDEMLPHNTDVQASESEAFTVEGGSRNDGSAETKAETDKVDSSLNSRRESMERHVTFNLD
ncbi:hypothetical protein BOX15_Mlig000149g2 [Macrostomum lignano]|uniref:Uncharacterized protein n=2 Tax=Macrostomum lignano TaxID=282301 RepID=A0A267DCF3_9PLAT|nr:hypothetical protein BOX15_Mlig000149g4 [Macrostomum lignano]PAA49939.1 hypothetical protein BOX15_Mlig000149g3 [Macrostomum lignano]PAA51470.1 hypothetical protein BOX15_Mlig000149g2 [Macrostomum lignano]